MLQAEKWDFSNFGRSNCILHNKTTFYIYLCKCELKVYIGKSKINSAKNLPPVVIKPGALGLGTSCDLLWSLADPRGTLGMCTPGPISFIFMQFLRKIWSNNTLAPCLGNPGSATADAFLTELTWHCSYDWDFLDLYIIMLLFPAKSSKFQMSIGAPTKVKLNNPQLTLVKLTQSGRHGSVTQDMPEF